MNGEKRVFSRVPFRAGSELTVGRISYAIERIYNLGLGGCLIPLEAGLKPGTRCRLKIMLGDAPAGAPCVCLDAEIVRREPGKAALKFVQIDSESFYHLQNIVRYNFPDPEKIEREICTRSGSA